MNKHQTAAQTRKTIEIIKKSVTVQPLEVIVSLRGALATKQSLKDCFAKNARNDTSFGTLPNDELLQKSGLKVSVMFMVGNILETAQSVVYFLGRYFYF